MNFSCTFSFEYDMPEIEIVAEVENFRPSRPAPYTKNSSLNKFYDDGQNLEADIRLFLLVNDKKIELPEELVDELNILQKVESAGIQIIENNLIEHKITQEGNDEY